LSGKVKSGCNANDWRNFEIKGITHSQTTISVSAGENAEIYATTLVDAKLEQEALFTFMGVQNKSIKKHFWRNYHRKIIICIYKF
jgi:hypothetical protein